MSPLILPRPEADEFAPFYASYIEEAPGENVGLMLTDQLLEIESVFGALNEQQAGYRYAPGKWSVKEVLGHVIDAERIFSYRMLRVSRGDATPLPGFDEGRYVLAANFDRRTMTDLLAELRAVRASTISLANGVAPGDWTNRGQANNYPVTTRALIYIILGHAAHHMNVVRMKYGLGAAAH